MQTINYDQIKEAAAHHPKPQNIKYTYGTAGFRMKYDLFLIILLVSL
jgi:hypothetical protein